MKFWIPDINNLTSNIPSSISLVDCDFSPYCDPEFCDSAYKYCVAVFNDHLYFRLDAESGQSGETCLGLPQK